MVWEKVEDHPEEGLTTWEYRGEGITKREQVPSHIVPCTHCGKNWTMHREDSMNVCIFCSSGFSPMQAYAYASEQELMSDTDTEGTQDPAADTGTETGASERKERGAPEDKQTEEEEDNPSRVRITL